MEIVTLNIADLDPAPYNPRKDLRPGDPEYDKLAKSIDAFGLVKPPVVNIRDGHNVVVGGHQRLKVLKERGYTKVKCSVVDLDPAREKLLNLALNKIEGSFEPDKLPDIFRELGMQDFDLDLTGFDAKEIEDIMDWTPEENQANPPDDFKEYSDDIDTQYRCPKCGYEWSGKPS